MQIKLGKRAPAVWFLGTPKNIIVSLNMVNPGPVDVDFDSLNAANKKHVLDAISKGQIEADVQHSELYKKWLLDIDPEEAKKEERIKAEAQKRLAERIQKQKEEQERIAQSIELKRIQAEERLARKKERDAKQIKELIDLTSRQIMKKISKKRDVGFLKDLLKAEHAKSNRKVVIEFVQNKIHRILLEKERKLSRQVKKATKETLKNLGTKETGKHVVIESEERAIVLTPEDLISSLY